MKQEQHEANNKEQINIIEIFPTLFNTNIQIRRFEPASLALDNNQIY